MRDAYSQCSKTGKSVEVTNTDQSNPPYLLGNFPRVDITFRCVTKVSNVLVTSNISFKADGFAAA
ncbi:MAG TPA: hypothetical protein VJ323_11595 [Bryobacteraceae bacterium]|nr:hypothetical protein [Bryobacteraceae bacterium]